MRIRPGDRPPVQRFANRPFNVELLQALRGSLGQPGGPPGFLENSSCAGLLARRSDCGSVAISVRVHSSKSARGETMPKEHKSESSSAASIEIANLVRAHGITRDQARRLVNRIGKNRAKLNEAARILKARLPLRSISVAEHSG